MNRFFLLICSLIFLNACNNSANVDKPTKLDTGDAKENEYLNAIAKYPDSPLLKETLIQYYEDNKNYDLALNELNTVLKKDSNNVAYWDKKAQLHILKGDTVNTIKCLEKAVEIFPEPAYIISLGVIYAQTKNEKSLAMADALLMSKKANADKEAIFIKGLYYSYSGDKQKAISFFNQCLGIDYNYTDAYREKGIALYDLNKFEDALVVFDKVVNLQNTYDEGYYWMGRCFEKLYRQQDAIDSYKTALSIDPDYIEAKDALGKLGIK